MKHRILLFLFFALLFIDVFGSEKVYVEPRQIVLRENQIWVYIDQQGWVGVSQLLSDAEGYYIKPKYQARDDWFRWLCNCGRYNFPTDNFCPYCGNPRYENEDEE